MSSGSSAAIAFEVRLAHCPHHLEPGPLVVGDKARDGPLALNGAHGADDGSAEVERGGERTDGIEYDDPLRIVGQFEIGEERRHLCGEIGLGQLVGRPRRDRTPGCPDLG